MAEVTFNSLYILNQNQLLKYLHYVIYKSQYLNLRTCPQFTGFYLVPRWEMSITYYFYLTILPNG